MRDNPLGIKHRKMPAEKRYRKTFPGYMMALLSSVIKLSYYLRES